MREVGQDVPPVQTTSEKHVPSRQLRADKKERDLAPVLPPVTFELRAGRSSLTSAEYKRMVALAAERGGRCRYDFVPPRSKRFYRFPFSW